MTQPHRIQSPYILFHVINRGNARQMVFRDHEDFLFYLDILKIYKRKYPIRLYHYVLMGNHIHLLLEPVQEGSLSKFMQSVTIAYTKYSNAKYKAVGHVWQSRFRSIVIQDDLYYLRCARYIELNPVRAQLVIHPGQYKWSSYHDHVDHRNSDLIDRHSLMEIFDSPEAGRTYREFIEEDIPNALSRKSETFSRQLVYGSSVFAGQFQ